jgi:hypothetical protein
MEADAASCPSESAIATTSCVLHCDPGFEQQQLYTVVYASRALPSQLRASACKCARTASPRPFVGRSGPSNPRLRDKSHESISLRLTARKHPETVAWCHKKGFPYCPSIFHAHGLLCFARCSDRESIRRNLATDHRGSASRRGAD